MIFSHSGSSAIGYHDSIYVFGGRLNDRFGSGDCQVYSLPCADKFDSRSTREKGWKILPPMMIPRFNHIAILHEEKIYVIGGRNHLGPVHTCECFDILSQSWVKDGIPDLAESDSVPVDPDDFGFSFGGYLYIKHHSDDSGYHVRDMLRYDSESRVWERVYYKLHETIEKTAPSYTIILNGGEISKTILVGGEKCKVIDYELKPACCTLL